MKDLLYLNQKQRNGHPVFLDEKLTEADEELMSAETNAEKMAGPQIRKFSLICSYKQGNTFRAHTLRSKRDVDELPSVRHLEYLPRSCQDLASSGKIFEEIQDRIQDLVKISKMKSKILPRYPRWNPISYPKTQYRFQENVCRTCSSSASNASRNWTMSLFWCGDSLLMCSYITYRTQIFKVSR